MKIRIDTPLQNQCVLSIDFRKAFDRVDRKYLIQILRKMNFALLLVDMLENLYGKANAIIVVGIFFQWRNITGKGYTTSLSTIRLILYCSFGATSWNFETTSTVWNPNETTSGSLCR